MVGIPTAPKRSRPKRMDMNRKLQTLCVGLGFTFGMSALQSAPAAQDNTAAKSEAIRFKRTAWKVGDAILAKSVVDGSLTVSMAVKGEVVQHFDQKNHELTQKKSVVLAAGEDGPTKVSVHYDEVVENQQSS